VTGVNNKAKKLYLKLSANVVWMFVCTCVAVIAKWTQAFNRRQKYNDEAKWRKSAKHGL